MSQKIEGTQTAALHGTGPINGRVAPAGGDRSQAVEAAAPTDSLRLTGEATNLQAVQRELAAAPAIDTARVNAVREAIENGSYRINPENIANRMLDLDRQLAG